jgi:NAD(P)H-hydrate epimerase
MTAANTDAPDALLTTAEMYRADQAAIAAGVSGVRLMENAGAAVARAVLALVPPGGRVRVLCGPGNNGGDGFVAARHLRTAGRDVRLALLGDAGKLRGDAAKHAAVWGDPIAPMDAEVVADADVIVDALFGAGLSRPLEGAAAELVRAANAHPAPVVSVDVPSGISGDTGQVVGDLAVRATRTVTFFRAKPGHLLQPGRGRCGVVEVADIGIPPRVLDDMAPRTWRNTPALWRAAWPWRHGTSHKYRHGHAVVLGGGRMSGAGRLAARAALRTGAGLVTAAVPEPAIPIYAAETASLITEALAPEAPLDPVLADPRRNAVLLGPGAGVSHTTRERAARLLQDGRALVLDADALSVFAGEVDALAQQRAGPLVLTPHAGEFARLFPDLDGDKLDRARAAAARTGAVLVLKGADTVVAAPDGRSAIADNAPPELATAGTGDVLAGIVLGALAQGVPAFEAACAAVWLQGAAAEAAPRPGLISDDLPAHIPAALAQLRAAADIVGGA